VAIAENHGRPVKVQPVAVAAYKNSEFKSMDTRECLIRLGNKPETFE
jgi:hypothetical protein